MGIADELSAKKKNSPHCFSFITLFPDLINAHFNTSIVARGRESGYYSVNLIDLNTYRISNTQKCDDAPYGGGAGMVLRPEPLSAAIDSVDDAEGRVVIYPSASGQLFDQQLVQKLHHCKNFLFICGRYEGVDQRIIDHYVDYEISIGDYVLSSGDLAAAVISDTLIRLIPGVINPQSLVEESYRDGLIEYPHYTRPAVWRGRKVPDVLLSGNHARISRWRTQESIKKTIQIRPDMT